MKLIVIYEDQHSAIQQYMNTGVSVHPQMRRVEVDLTDDQSALLMPRTVGRNHQEAKDVKEAVARIFLEDQTNEH